MARAAGARCVETDVAVQMLTHRRSHPRRAVSADGRRLPFVSGRFDIATFACSLSHVPDPEAMLAEARRVLAPGGLVLASAFPVEERSHPVKDCVDATLAHAGYEPPEWYARLKRSGEPRVATRRALLTLANVAGLHDAEVVESSVETGLRSPAALVDWRMGMAQYAPFLAGLTDTQRAETREAALAALGHTPPALVLRLLVLCAHA